MTPQFVDFHGDGRSGLLMGAFDGNAHLVKRDADGWCASVILKDLEGQPVRAQRRVAEGAEPAAEETKGEAQQNGEGKAVACAAVDWDHDGDQDIVLAGYESGRFYLCENVGTKNAPAFSPGNRRVPSAEGQLRLRTGVMSIQVVDWNRDGLFDLVCGGHSGGVYAMVNRGDEGAPAFPKVETLIPAAQDGDALGCKAWEGTFETIVPYTEGAPACPSRSVHAYVADVDEDGDLDVFLSGRAFYLEPREAPLTDAEREQIKVLKAELSRVTEEMQGDEDDLNIDPDSQLWAKWKELDRKLKLLEPDPVSTEEYLWLYRNSETTAVPSPSDSRDPRR